MMKHKHPEVQDGEVYMGNFSSLDQVGWLTSRMGQQAYDIYGNASKENTHWPVFVRKSELINGLRNLRVDENQNMIYSNEGNAECVKVVGRYR